MPWPGRYQLADRDGKVLQEGGCRISFDAEAFSVVPDSGAPLAGDLGEVLAVAPADVEVVLSLPGGRTLRLGRMGKAFPGASSDLVAAWRDRTVKCLLLGDLEEVKRFSGAARLASSPRPPAPAEIRVFESNLAVLPVSDPAFQWRLADVDALRLDTAAWAVVLESDGERLELTRLAKRTEECHACLGETLSALQARSVAGLRAVLPFLEPLQLQRAAELLREGRSAAIEQLRAVHPRIEAALMANVVDDGLRPYVEWLVERAAGGGVRVGFKIVPEGEGKGEGEEEGRGEGQGEAEEGRDDGEGAGRILHWFFFPIAAKGGVPRVVAWEATSRSGRATYFFRLASPGEGVERTIRDLERAMALLGFRREPMYLPDDALELQPRYRRHAIACRRVPELARLRAAFLGRAIHTTPDAWRKQAEEILAKG